MLIVNAHAVELPQTAPNMPHETVDAIANAASEAIAHPFIRGLEQIIAKTGTGNYTAHVGKRMTVAKE